MAELSFGPTADQMLARLEADSQRHAGVLVELHTALDRLETDPADPWCRRRAYRELGVWAIGVPCEGAQWLVLWSAAHERVVVHAILPATGTVQ